ncbi:hypothetical protein [Azospirillum largimobile]
MLSNVENPQRHQRRRGNHSGTPSCTGGRRDATSAACLDPCHLDHGRRMSYLPTGPRGRPRQ